jgi:hypothetical protein
MNGYILTNTTKCVCYQGWVDGQATSYGNNTIINKCSVVQKSNGTDNINKITDDTQTEETKTDNSFPTVNIFNLTI